MSAKPVKNSDTDEALATPESTSLISGKDAKMKKPGKRTTKSQKITIKEGKKDSGHAEPESDHIVKTKKRTRITKATNAKTGVKEPADNSEIPEKETVGEIIPEENIAVEEEQDQEREIEPGTEGYPEDAPADENKIDSQVFTNFASFNKQDLCKIFEDLINTRNVNEIRDDIEAIKINFYKKYKAEIETLKRKFIEDGGEPESFQTPVDPWEEKMKELLKKYRSLRTEQNRIQDDEKVENLKRKYGIIEEIKELINSEESINKTFHEFRELQTRWREIGVVPQQNLNDLWETYHHHVEKFYDYIKINKELRDLDLKKNLELKIQLCEKTESLLLEPNIINAFSLLQKYHEQWREIGPVPKEKKNEIWERFREATSKINKKHQTYYQELKESQRKNLESKTILCEKAEAIISGSLQQHREWVSGTKEILELQRVWKTIGFAPKKENNKIYARFRSACDKFFERKREFYSRTLEEQNNNLQIKLDLCAQAEFLKDSTDWKRTSEEFIRLQKKWKEIGPVPRKQSDAVWKRFRSACDSFFERKTEFFSKIDNTYESNLQAKENLINEILEYNNSENVNDSLEKLQEFQRKWMDIGFVPFNKKEEIQNRFRDAVNKFYDSLEMDDFKKNILKFKNRLDSILKKPKPELKLRFEREKYMNKLQQLKTDIGVWENNIGFFSNSRNADSMIKEFEAKIREAKITIRTLEEKINLIDELDFDL
jgi:predicted  nucleic acid-binding Zn-ribbon protein